MKITNILVMIVILAGIVAIVTFKGSYNQEETSTNDIRVGAAEEEEYVVDQDGFFDASERNLDDLITIPIEEEQQ